MKISLKPFLTFLIAIIIAMPAVAKKYKWEFNSRIPQVYTIGQGKHGLQLVKVWAVGKNADKAIVQAKMDAVTAALFYGIAPDKSTNGMGTADLPPILNDKQYYDNKKLLDEFFKKGEFLRYVKEINSTYPTGENNISVPGGRRIGINLSVDYRGLHQWLQDNGIEKGVGGHFKNQ